MKKTPKTMLMAALFASAISATSTGAVTGNADYVPSDEQMQDAYGPPVIEETTTQMTAVYSAPIYYTTTTPATVTNPITETTTDMICVYGPPPDYSTTTSQTQTTAKDPITETTTELAGVYGPPPVSNGDINDDGRIDVFDFIELKKMITNNTAQPIESYKAYKADVNHDEQVGMADLVMLNNYLLGKVDNFYDDIIPEPQPTTTRYYDNTTVNTVTTTQDAIPAPVYGPPSWFTTQTTVTITQNTTEPVPQPEYGAPIAFD